MKNIIITGGELNNKGAQAMTFVTVNELKKRFPCHAIYLASDQDCCRADSDKNQYSFNLLCWFPGIFAKAQKNLLLRAICKFRHPKEFADCNEIYKNTVLMVDVSGYALGTIWSENANQLYINNLRYAKAYGIPVYLMPQSIGPLDFELHGQRKTAKQLKKLLSYCKVICAREEESMEELKKFGIVNNVVQKPDLVLNNKGIDLCNVYRTLPELDIPKIKADSVCIIPNTRNESVGDKNKILELYSCLISRLAEKKKTIYIMMHSSQDAELCREIKLAHADETNVILLDKDYSCIEFNEIVKQFDFVIASRYHSIVHAYKNGIPCLVLGWATKYHELLKQFGQLDYMFDFRGNVDTESLLAAMDKLIEARDEESKRILKELDKIQQDNVFDILELK